MPAIDWVVFKLPGHAHITLVPSTATDLKTVAQQRWKHGDVVTAQFRKPRDGRHHRKVFGLLRFVFEAQERFDHPEALRRHLTLKTSFVVETVDRATGRVLRMPRSWSYDELDQVDFEQLHEELYAAVTGEFFPTETVNWLKRAIDEQAFMDGVISFFS
jgi:hypothetical protein